MSDMHIYAAEDESGPVEYLAILPPEVVTTTGLIPDAIVGTRRSGSTVFEPNPAFAAVLHDVIARLGPEQPGLRAEAQRTGTGWLYVIDLRTATPDGPVPPEDIMGYFAVAAGGIVPGSYSPNPGHQLVSERGPVRLEDGLRSALVKELRARAGS